MARDYGFHGGLVPGVVVYAYLVRPVAERWGRTWVENGALSARFVSPVYDGETVEVDLSETGDLEGRVGGRTVATGFASRSGDRPTPVVAHYPTAAAPTERPPASEEAFRAIEVLGSLEAGFHLDRAGEYLDAIADDLPLWGQLAHPGWLIQWANWILAANVKLGPWIHVASEVCHFSAVADGEQISTRGRVAEVFERKGHRFVVLDLLQAVSDRPVAIIRHTAIYEPRPQRS